MTLSRREFLNITGNLLGGWVLASPGLSYLGNLARSLVAMRDLEERKGRLGIEDREVLRSKSSPTTPDSTQSGISIPPESKRVLDEIGYFNDISPARYVFDENKYSPSKRKLDPSQWDSTNRHLPIKLGPQVINKPGERSPQALKRVVAYTQFSSPRYVAEPGKRVTMCNIAAWDWSRALQLHLPHWIGDTEMSANMLFRWVSHPQAGGIFGEGWQSLRASAAPILASLGIPVFALAENTRPGRHGHVAMVYPQNNDTGIYFATVNNGRSHGGNGIKSLGNTFRRLKPTYFVHKYDFIVYLNS
jgi:hypothetical protein